MVSGVLSNGKKLFRAFQDGRQNLQGTGTRLECQDDSHRSVRSRDPGSLLSIGSILQVLRAILLDKGKGRLHQVLRAATWYHLTTRKVAMGQQ